MLEPVRRGSIMATLTQQGDVWMMRDGAKNMIGTADWEKVKDRYLRTYRDVCGWHEKIGFDEMLQHGFLSDDRLVQQSRFSSGWTVVVNFSDDPWKDARGFSVKAHSHHTFREVPLLPSSSPTLQGKSRAIADDRPTTEADHIAP